MKTRLPPFSAEELRRLVNYDTETGIFTWLAQRQRVSAGDVAGSRNASGYWSIMIDYRGYLAHRLAWFYMYGEWPEALDHINRNRSDNRIGNLRIATQAENKCNAKHPPNSSGLQGANWDHQRGMYRVRVSFKRRRRDFGYYKTALEAHVAYKMAVQALQGEFAPK